MQYRKIIRVQWHCRLNRNCLLGVWHGESAKHERLTQKSMNYGCERYPNPNRAFKQKQHGAQRESNSPWNQTRGGRRTGLWQWHKNQRLVGRCVAYMCRRGGKRGGAWVFFPGVGSSVDCQSAVSLIPARWLMWSLGMRQRCCQRKKRVLQWRFDWPAIKAGHSRSLSNESRGSGRKDPRSGALIPSWKEQYEILFLEYVLCTIGICIL